LIEVALEQLEAGVTTILAARGDQPHRISLACSVLPADATRRTT
jgi:hypothetical protein